MFYSKLYLRQVDWCYRYNKEMRTWNKLNAILTEPRAHHSALQQDQKTSLLIGMLHKYLKLHLHELWISTQCLITGGSYTRGVLLPTDTYEDGNQVGGSPSILPFNLIGHCTGFVNATHFIIVGGIK